MLQRMSRSTSLAQQKQKAKRHPNTKSKRVMPRRNPSLPMARRKPLRRMHTRIRLRPRRKSLGQAPIFAAHINCRKSGLYSAAPIASPGMFSSLSIRNCALRPALKSVCLGNPNLALMPHRVQATGQSRKPRGLTWPSRAQLESIPPKVKRIMMRVTIRNTMAKTAMAIKWPPKKPNAIH